MFNNLNTLDQLIEEDKDKASNFLHHFSELYRYSLEINQNNKTAEIRVPPFCLHVLIENAMEHNLGVIKNPVHIAISISQNIQVTNNKITKQHIKKLVVGHLKTCPLNLLY